jgi:hypothetical protein
MHSTADGKMVHTRYEQIESARSRQIESQMGHYDHPDAIQQLQRPFPNKLIILNTMFSMPETTNSCHSVIKIPGIPHPYIYEPQTLLILPL